MGGGPVPYFILIESPETVCGISQLCFSLLCWSVFLQQDLLPVASLLAARGWHSPSLTPNCPCGTYQGCCGCLQCGRVSARAALVAPPHLRSLAPVSRRLTNSPRPPQVSPVFLVFPHLSAPASLAFPKGFWGDCVFKRKTKTKPKTIGHLMSQGQTAW